MAIHNVVVLEDLGRGLDVNKLDKKIHVKVDNKTIALNNDGELQAKNQVGGGTSVPYKKYSSVFKKTSETVVIKHDVVKPAYTIVRVTSKDGTTYHPHSPIVSELYQVTESYQNKTVFVDKNFLASKLNGATIEVFVYEAQK